MAMTETRCGTTAPTVQVLQPRAHARRLSRLSECVRSVRNISSWSAEVDGGRSGGANLPNGPEGVNDLRERWDRMTQELVQLSTVPFVMLLVPQVIRNAVNMLSENLGALSILSWMGFMSALLGNTILLSYFVSKGERGAALVQAIGVASNFVMLVQIFWAGFLGSPIFWSMAGFTAVSCFVNAAYVTGSLRQQAWAIGPWVWKCWQTLLGILGLGVFVQVMWLTFAQPKTLAPGCLVALAGLIVVLLETFGLLPKSVRDIWGGLSAWTATLLFAFQPIGQLVRNFTDPSSLEGLSLGTILLAMTGNGLMVPRALFTRDVIWLTGTLWGSLMMGWAQLLSMFVGQSEAGLQHLNHAMFLVVSAVLAAYFVCVFVADMHTRTSENRWSSQPKSFAKD